MKRLLRVLLSGLLLAVCVPLHAAPLSGEAARTQLREQLTNIRAFQAQFSQRVTDTEGRLVEEGTGQFWLARPDRFRWQYQTPWPRLLLADGERIWLYDEELEQVTVRDMDGVLEQTPAALLAGDLEQLAAYDISAEQSDSILAVRLIPRESRQDFRQIDMAFVNGTLARLELYDQFGQHTRIDFTAAVRNPDLAIERFQFVIPDGADVIDESSG